MGILTRSLQGDYSKALSDFISGADIDVKSLSNSVYISEATSMSLTAVWASVRLIAWTIASLPINYYQRLQPRGKEKIHDDIYRLLHDAPNPMMTAFKWRELMAIHQNLWGAGVSEIEFTPDRQRPVALWPLPVWRIKPILIDKNKIIYRLQLENGQTIDYRQDQLLIFPSLSSGIYQWQSPISTHRQTLCAAATVKEFGAKTFSQGTNPSGILSGIKAGDEKSDESLKEKYKAYEGLSNSHRVMMLGEGVKFERVGLPPEDAQYLQTRQFDISEIARIYNVPLHLLQSFEKGASTWGTGLEELNQGFIVYTMRPYLVQWEQEINKKLIFDKSTFVEFLIDGLYRGKLYDRSQAYQIAIQNGWKSINDVRELENENPVPGGDEYRVQLNTTPINSSPAPQKGLEKPAEDKDGVDSLDVINSLKTAKKNNKKLMFTFAEN